MSAKERGSHELFQNNDRDQRAAGVDIDLTRNQTTAAPLHPMGTPVMAYDLWGVSPLYENEVLKMTGYQLCL